MGNKKPNIDLIEKRNKTSQDWLKTAAYLDTENQNSINYIYVSPKITTQNNIAADAGYFIRSEIDSTDLKNQILQQKQQLKGLLISTKNKSEKDHILFQVLF